MIFQVSIRKQYISDIILNLMTDIFNFIVMFVEKSVGFLVIYQASHHARNATMLRQVFKKFLRIIIVKGFFCDCRRNILPLGTVFQKDIKSKSFMIIRMCTCVHKKTSEGIKSHNYSASIKSIGDNQSSSVRS